MNDELVTIYLWPDDCWCDEDELEEMLKHKSDDYTQKRLTQEEYESLL